MIFDEYQFGDYRIFAGAIEGPCGDGFIAAVVVDQVVDRRAAASLIFQDDALCCGHRWPSGKEALEYAMRKGMEKALAARHPERAKRVNGAARAAVVPAAPALMETP